MSSTTIASTTPAIYPAIMCGGSGTRLWPLSRALFPKQFLPLVNDTSMLQDTLLRLPKNSSQPLFICNEEHRFLVAEQVRRLSQEQSTILLEPEGRNTAPAVALAAIHALEKDENAMLLVLAADHVIQDSSAFHQAVEQASIAAQQGKLVTFGIVPTHAETGYGYIKKGSEQTSGTFDVAQFVEKPNAHVAENYLASGSYLWNSGMFLFKASRYLEELAKHRSDILENCQQAMTCLLYTSDAADE